MFDVRCSRFAVQGSRFNVRLSGRILIQLPCGWKRSSPSPSPKEERAGERRPLLLNAPHPNPLPTRSSRGEGENFWWLCLDALRLSTLNAHPLSCLARSLRGFLDDNAADLRRLNDVDARARHYEEPTVPGDGDRFTVLDGDTATVVQFEAPFSAS